MYFFALVTFVGFEYFRKATSLEAFTALTFYLLYIFSETYSNSYILKLITLFVFWIITEDNTEYKLYKNFAYNIFSDFMKMKGNKFYGTYNSL